MIIPSTTVSVLRTDQTNPPLDGNGDPVDSDTVAVSGLPASITPWNQRTLDPASGQYVVVNKFQIQLRPQAFEFTEHDRIQDERTDALYQVENVITSAAMLMQEAITLRCSQVR